MRHLLRDISIRTKYLLAMAVLLLAIFLSGSFIFLKSYQYAYQEQMNSAMNDMMNGYEEISRFEKRMQHLGLMLQSNEKAVELLEVMDELTVPEYQRATQSLLPLLYTMSDASDDYICRLYVNANSDYINPTSRILHLSSIEQEDWMQQVMSGWGWRRFYSAASLDTDDPALLVPIRSAEHRDHLIALLRIDVRRSALERMLMPVRSGDFVTSYIETPGNQVVAVSGVPLERMDYLHSLSESERTGFNAPDWHTLETDGCTIVYQQFPASQWMLCTVVHHDRLMSSVMPRYITTFLIGLLLASMGMLLAVPVLWRTTSRIKRFHAHVQQYNVSKTDDSSFVMPSRLAVQSHDEIGELIDAHNAMLDRIDELTRLRSQNEQELLRLEIFALQAQIKPHFLYNTLEAITWMARMNCTDKVEQTITSLTSFYRLCLSNGSDILPISQELEIVRHYFSIACTRYESQFALEIDVAPSAMDILLPKLVLQPLVENALMHGLLESGQPTGCIRIFTRGDGQKMELCIADSGAHFTQQAWDRLFSHPEKFESVDGYGLLNVERRLCLYFHRPRTLMLDLSDERYTIIAIPLLTVCEKNSHPQMDGNPSKINPAAGDREARHDPLFSSEMQE